MSNYDFYHDKRWGRVRRRVLRRDRELCVESLRYGKRVDAVVVHHIYPLEEYPEYALAQWNLISLCEEKHNAMHDRKTGRLTALGEQWKRRVAPPPRR